MSKEFEKWIDEYQIEYRKRNWSDKIFFDYADMTNSWNGCKNKVLEILEKYNHVSAYPYIKEDIENNL